MDDHLDASLSGPYAMIDNWERSGAQLRVVALLCLLGITACAPFGSSSHTTFGPGTSARRSIAGPSEPPACSNCNMTIPMPAELTRAIESRLSDLEKRGGLCSRYAEVLERSYRAGRITIRPYMWRVGGRLVSGETQPNGDMTLAREIDSLNVGVRTVDDVVWSVEHEAVHVAFGIESGGGLHEDRANRYVRACRDDDSSG